MALTNKQKQAAYRERMKKRGLKPRIIYLNDDENKQVKAFIVKIRK